MLLIQTYVALVGALNGFFLSVLLTMDRRGAHNSRILGIICLVVALMFCLPFLLWAEPGGVATFLVGWLFYLPASLGGLIYLYTRNTLLDRRPARRDLVHLAPAALPLLVALDYALLKPGELAQWITGAWMGTTRLAAAELLLFLPIFLYLPVTIWMLLAHRRRAAEELANFPPATFFWLLTLLSVTAAFWALKAVFALTAVSHPYAFSAAADVLLAGLLYLIAGLQWRHPGFFALRQLKDVPRERRAAPSSPGLDADSLAKLFRSVSRTVEEGELYKDSELTLSRLAERTGLSTHHLSEVLNRKAGENFYAFVNGYRVAYVRRALEERPEAKVLDLGMEAGFASKSTFNAIFKQATGKTPTAYRRSRVEEVRGGRVKRPS